MIKARLGARHGARRGPDGGHTGLPILDPVIHDQSQAVGEARGDTGARQGPHRATESRSWVLGAHDLSQVGGQAVGETGARRGPPTMFLLATWPRELSGTRLAHSLDLAKSQGGAQILVSKH